MKKKISLMVLAFMLFATAVSASSINGDYNGNPIVKIVSNGKVIDPGEVPAIIYEGKTMVPISALRNLGVEVTWIPETYSVNASLPLQDTYNDPKEMMKRVQTITNSLGGKSTKLIYDQYGSYISVRYDSSGDPNKDADIIKKLAAVTGITDTQETRINYFVNNEHSAEIVASFEDAELWISGKITNEQYTNRFKITLKQPQATVPLNGSETTPLATKTNTLLLYSNDGKTYLGKLTTDKFDKDSIFNEYGTYGSKYQTKSIWNEYGIYGSEYSDTSAFNDNATKPPMILQNGKVIGYLTTNSYTPGAISPYGLDAILNNL